jgi:uncharacterized protein with NRDE domain
MCLIVFAYHAVPGYKLVLAANRDEFYQRPTASASFWEDYPGVLAGRDLVAGGTWLGITRSGRFAALTNYRDPVRHKKAAPSRGDLVSTYLCGNASPQEYLYALAGRSHLYNGFNLLVGDARSLYYYSNYKQQRVLTPGFYGLSNHVLDTPWPKVYRSKVALQSQLRDREPEPAQLFMLLTDTNRAADHELPRTGVGLEWERILSPIYIASPEYGTRSSSVLTITQQGNVCFTERTFCLGDKATHSDRAFSFTIE